jgi:hypothetical protein
MKGESRGMGEGWSDAFAWAFGMSEKDTRNSSKG